jgi:hypothetical protein
MATGQGSARLWVVVDRRGSNRAEHGGDDAPGDRLITPIYPTIAGYSAHLLVLIVWGT